MNDKILLPGAWELTEVATLSLFQLNVPITWQQKAQYLTTERFKKRGGYPSIPVYSLDPIISACFPQIVKTIRKGWQKPGVPWPG